jgi:hypothetical protein
VTPAERRCVARVLREAARIVAEGDEWNVYWDGACDAIFAADDAHDGAFDSFYVAMYGCPLSLYFWTLDETHRSVRVIALLLTAEAVLTGDCDD